MADEREQAMLDLMTEANEHLRELREQAARTHNVVNEMWAEWTRLHEPTIDRSGPVKKVAQEQQETIARRKVARRG